MTTADFKQLSLQDKLSALYGERVSSLFHAVLTSEIPACYAGGAAYIQTKHAADWLHRCIMHSHWGNPKVALGEFSVHWRFGALGLDVVKLDQDCDRFFDMCYRIQGGTPEFPPITLDNQALSFTCPGL